MARASLFVLAAAAGIAAAQRTVYLLDRGWKWEMDTGSGGSCPDVNTSFPINLNGQQCAGLTQASANSLDECAAACCGSSTCQVYQWCQDASCSPNPSCWIGSMSSCTANGQNWLSRGRNASVTPSDPCSQPQCQPGTPDASWNATDLPHDFVVLGDFSPNADKSHGYLPYGVAWYRRHLTIPASAQNAVMYVEFEGIQTASAVWLNGRLLGTHASGYTPSRYAIPAAWVNFGADNVLAVQADCTNPDGWWYDGGGIYRHVWLTIINTPGPYIAPLGGVYAPSTVTGTIAWGAGGQPYGAGAVSPSVEVWNAATSAQSFALSFTVLDPAGNVVVTGSGSGSVGANASYMWNATTPLSLGNTSLWHLVAPPLKPALYTLQTVLTVGGAAVDSHNTTFGVRRTRWDAATGFYLNDVATKILGMANHQDFAGVGVAVPDVLQWHRIQKLKDFGGNGWRTAHNPPNPALLAAADELGFLVWDENHRNAQFSEAELLIRRDRNHPSVVIWSICNEILCNTNNSAGDALQMKEWMHSLDWSGNRPVSANQNGYIGPNTPLDVQGFDYSTGNYDQWHQQAPNIPSISSETSSAVGDRGEYADDAVGGHVSGYDTEYPGWGESAQQAWGGIGMTNGQGILTRPFISGGWTWTGWDYRGEPTPYGWPDVNSHFGVYDLAGYHKDRTFWYRMWFANPSPAELHVFPHWNWPTGTAVSIWAYSNADEVELFVNGVSAGRKAMPQYAHVQWDGVQYAAGNITAVAYVAGNAVTTQSRVTAGAPAQLNITIKDGVGAQLMAGCKDVALVSVAVLDAAGNLVPSASNNVTFTVTGPATYAGASNGDPACLVNNKSPTRPAYHGLVLAVIAGGDTTGTVTVTATSPGLAPVSVQIPQVAPAPGFSEYWCHTNPTL